MFDFVEAVDLTTEGRGVDVILDIVGGDYLERNLEALAVDGRLVQIGLMGGAKAQINLRAGAAAAAHDHRLDAASAHRRKRKARSPERSRRTSGRC